LRGYHRGKWSTTSNTDQNQIQLTLNGYTQLVTDRIKQGWSSYLVTILLSLFLALNKRRHEMVLLQGEASNHRQILKEYSLPLLDQMIAIVTAATLMAYSLYTFQGPTGNHRLMITIPLVLYGMFRYLYLVYMRTEGGSPEEVLLRDRHMLGTVVLCAAVIIITLYVLPG